MFNVICLETGEPERNADGTPIMFPDGRTAATTAQTLSAQHGKKFQPRPVKDLSWKEREATRLADGTYTRVPWDDGTDWTWWLRYRDPEAAHHYAHVSTKSPGCIAFTETDEKGAADIQAVMKPGRYLTRFYPRLGDETIREKANEFLAQYGKLKLCFADTADDIERVYVAGPRSCMSHEASSFDSSCHPCRVYAAGDLAVAYLVSEDDGDHITSRALCWPEKKKFGRVYGDGKLEQMLSNDGWRYSSQFADGARMTKIMDGDAYVVPYIDGIYRADDCGKFLKITEGGEIDCEQTNGLSARRWICDSCGDSADEEYSSYIDSRDERWCDDCASRHAFYCEMRGEMIANDDGVEMADGSYWSERRFSREGVTCEATGENYPMDDTVTLENGTVWSQSYFEDHGRQCHSCGACMENDETCDSCGEDDVADDSTPRPHVARQGRDESPAQTELLLEPHLAAKVGDYVRVQGCDGGIADGVYRVTQVDDYPGCTMRVMINAGGRDGTWWLRNAYVKAVIAAELAPALTAKVGDMVRVEGDNTVP